MPLIQLQVPDDAEVGDSLTFVISGKELEVPVPDGSTAGDILQIQIDDDLALGNDGQSNGDEEDYRDTSKENDAEANTRIIQDGNNDANKNDDFKVPLHESLGITLEIQCSIKNNALYDPNKNNEDPSDGTYAMAWPAGIHLSKCISSPSFYKFTKRKKAIIELGSGLGVVGLSFIATASKLLSHRKHDVKEIKLVLTDLPCALPIIKHNVKHNMDKMCGISDESDNIAIEHLVWGDKSHVCSLGGKIDLILASDILYNAKMQTYESLCDTIATLIKKEDDCGDATTKSITNKSRCEILLAVRWRKPEEERQFFQLMETNLGFHFDLVLDGIEKEAYQCDLSWRDYGNPDCIKSNEYFTNTFVKVRGKSIALKDITENHMESMSEEEYINFEARYIQIYVGRMKDTHS